MVENEGESIPLTTSPEDVLIQILHNFRAPLATIKGYAAVIRQEIGHIEEGAEEIHRIAENLEAELKLVHEYLLAVKDRENT